MNKSITQTGNFWRLSFYEKYADNQKVTNEYNVRWRTNNNSNM